MRQLKHHEQKLLKKVDFLSWKQDASHREIKVMRKYHIQDREDYHKYNKLCGSMRSLVHRLSLLPAEDPFRAQKEAEMLNKLWDMGILDLNAKPSDIENKLTVSSVARRRLAVVVTKLKMAETVSDVGDPIPTQAYSVSLPLGGRSAVNEETELIIQAVRTIEQGHIRVGPSPVTDPAMLVTRQLEDFVTWVDTSARKRTIMKYNDELDDFELM